MTKVEKADWANETALKETPCCPQGRRCVNELLLTNLFKTPIHQDPADVQDADTCEALHELIGELYTASQKGPCFLQQASCLFSTLPFKRPDQDKGNEETWMPTSPVVFYTSTADLDKRHLAGYLVLRELLLNEFQKKTLTDIIYSELCATIFPPPPLVCISWHRTEDGPRITRFPWNTTILRARLAYGQGEHSHEHRPVLPPFRVHLPLPPEVISASELVDSRLISALGAELVKPFWGHELAALVVNKVENAYGDVQSSESFKRIREQGVPDRLKTYCQSIQDSYRSQVLAFCEETTRLDWGGLDSQLAAEYGRVLKERLNSSLKDFVRLVVAFSSIPDVTEVVFCPSYTHAVRNDEVLHKGAGGPLFFCRENASAAINQECIACLWLRVSIALEEPAILAWQRRGMEAAEAKAHAEHQRTRASAAETLANERLQILAAFAHDAKREPEILSHVLRSQDIPQDLKPVLTARLAEGLVERSLAYAALGACTGRRSREQVISDLRSERDQCKAAPQQMSIRDIFARELALVFLRVLVAGGPFGEVRAALFHDSTRMWATMRPFLEYLAKGFYFDAVSSLPEELAKGIILPSSRFSVPTRLDGGLLGERQADEPRLRIALSFIFGELLSNMIRHAFSPCRKTFLDKRTLGLFPLFHMGLNIEQSADAMELSFFYEPGREQSAVADLRGTGLVSLGLVAKGIGAEFSKHTEVIANTEVALRDVRPWFGKSFRDGLIYNNWNLIKLTSEGVIDNDK